MFPRLAEDPRTLTLHPQNLLNKIRLRRSFARATRQSWHLTMPRKAERDVHEGVSRDVAGSAHMVVLAQGQDSPFGGADELGDNVEFF